MKISIERNLKNIKAKKEIFDDYYLNKIVKLTIKYHHIKGINIFVQSMLYLKNIEEYDTNLYVFNMTYGESIEKIDILYNIFRDGSHLKNMI